MHTDDDEMQRRVASFFDREAARFQSVDDVNVEWSKRLINAVFRRSLRLRYERTMTECVEIEGKTVLDIGCGPGAYSAVLAQRGARSVTGIDIAPQMIEIANRRAAEAGVSGQCKFLHSDLDNYQSETLFDYVIAMGILDYVGRADQFVRKALALTASKALFSFPKQAGILAWQRRFRYRHKCPVFTYSRGDLDALFRPISAVQYGIESIARDWLVVATKDRRP
jgi:2-polyprenyl-3-methyl-5-hydroxy-6-metoxy-1,4-benzoquinol methylase